MVYRGCTSIAYNVNVKCPIIHVLHSNCSTYTHQPTWNHLPSVVAFRLLRMFIVAMQMERVCRLFTSTTRMNHHIIMRFKSWYISTDVRLNPSTHQQANNSATAKTKSHPYQKKMNSNTILILNVTVILGLAYLLASATPIPRAPRQASTSTPIPTDACQDVPVSNLIFSFKLNCHNYTYV